ELDASDPDKPFVAGPNGFYGQLIDLAGGTNVFGDLPGDVGQVGAEIVVARDPEVIILTDADLPFSPQTPEMVAARPGWGTICAVGVCGVDRPVVRRAVVRGSVRCGPAPAGRPRAHDAESRRRHALRANLAASRRSDFLCHPPAAHRRRGDRRCGTSQRRGAI